MSSVSLFLLNHRRKTASTYRRTCATAVGTDDQTPCQDSPPLEDVGANSNLILVNMIRDLAALWNHADQLVNDFYLQLKHLDQRTDQAKSRLAHLHRRCRTLQLPPTDAASAGSLRRFLNVRNHYQSMKLEDDCNDGETVKMNYTNLFLPSTRPCYLIKFQQELKKAEIAWSCMYTKKPTQTACVQTDPDEAFSNDDFCRPRDRRKSSFSADPPLPTPEQQAQQLVALCKPITLEINANGRACPAGNNVNNNQHKVSEFSEKSTFGRASQTTGLSRLRLRSADGFSINIQSNDNEDTYTGAVQQTVDLFECSAAKEYLYDFAPFYRRRTERLGGMKQFLSLRRPKKIHALHSTEKSANNSTDEYKTKPSDRIKTHFDIASISKFFKRSFSFRSAPSKPAVCVDKPIAACQSKIIANGTENSLETIEESQESSRQIWLGKPKTSLPISTSSQVMNLATLLRRSSRKVKPQESVERNQTAPSSRSSKDSAYMSGGERKARVVSFLSAESNTSLEVSDKKHASTYRVGFKLNYPEECKLNIISNNNSSISNSNIQPQHLVDLQRLEHTSQWVPGSPSVNSNCSAIDSNYSCDHEGYFTSMHHDSGLPLPSYNCETVTDAGRGRSFSTHSSASTLADGAHLSQSDSSSATTPPASSFFPHVSIHSSPCMQTRTTAPQYMPHSIYVNSCPKVFSTELQPFCSENPYVFGPHATMNFNNSHLQMKPSRVVPFMQCSGCRPLNSLPPVRYLHLPSPLEANHIPQPTDFYYVQRNHLPLKVANGYQQFNNTASLQSAVKNGEAWGMPSSQVFSCAQAQDNYGMYRPVESRTESSATCCSNSQIPEDDKMDPFDRWLVAKFCVEQQEAKLKEAKLAERAKLAAWTCQKAKKTSGACLEDNYKNCKIDILQIIPKMRPWGRMAKIYGMYQFALSPFEQKAFGGYGKEIRNLGSKAFEYWWTLLAIPALYYLRDYGMKQEEKRLRFNILNKSICKIMRQVFLSSYNLTLHVVVRRLCTNANVEWNSRKVRQTFINYFKKWNHVVVESSSMIAPKQSGMLFTSAGVVQFKPIISNLNVPVQQSRPMHPLGLAVSCQKCARVNDLNLVGKDRTHHTFFEMLGNWSFNGTMSKQTVCTHVWQLLTKIYCIDEQRLHVTYFGGDQQLGLDADQECKRIWLDVVGVQQCRLLIGNAEENFWSIGETGPCGPCTEIHIQLPDGTLSELWNVVFMEYYKHEDGSLQKLPATHVDTGMGLERLCAVLQNEDSAYGTDLFKPLIDSCQKLTGSHPYEGRFGVDDVTGLDSSHRIIVDHARMCTFAIADGLKPGHQEAGHVLRKIIRRALYHVSLLGEPRPGVFPNLCSAVVDLYADTYPQLQSSRRLIDQVLVEEEKRFSGTLTKAKARFDRMQEPIDPEAMFLFYNTYGLPMEMVQNLAERRGVPFDLQEFEQRLQEQRRRSLTTRQKQQLRVALLQLELPSNTDDTLKHSTMETQTKDGSVVYQTVCCEGRVLAILRSQTPVTEVTSDDHVQCSVILDKTSFYATDDGQTGDRGILRWREGEFLVDSTTSLEDVVLHHGRVLCGRLIAGQTSVHCLVDVNFRTACMQQHTAVHLILGILRQHLNISTEQPLTSMINRQSAWIQFYSLQSVQSKNYLLQLIDKHANMLIEQNCPVITQIMNLENAKLLLKDDFPQVIDSKTKTIRLVTLDIKPNPIHQLCRAGTHVSTLGKLYHFSPLSLVEVNEGYSSLTLQGSAKIGLSFIMTLFGKCNATAGNALSITTKRSSAITLAIYRVCAGPHANF
ncbi:Alanine--tRNA ligase, cytoplasmic [Trichinella zimbabwensis]|uniref:alanine--tRNA ligase n=1 Tax=Trichinella zimbabwensis TaxID=268475 RepID=A0A0V1HA45_9BILA|nr:Alanine--tRNA ligase, cytoplasmic [Trichinella zimbabwensis]